MHHLCSVPGRNCKLAAAVPSLRSSVWEAILLLGSVTTGRRRTIRGTTWSDVDDLGGTFQEQVGRVVEREDAIALLEPQLLWPRAAFRSRRLDAAVSPIRRLDGPDRLMCRPRWKLPSPRRFRVTGGLSIVRCARVAFRYQSDFIGEPVVGRVSGRPTIRVRPTE